jgi:iron complex outermembrane receptor protein
MDAPRAFAAHRNLACGLLTILLGAWASAVESAPDLYSPIPPQPLAAALAEFAHQTRLQLVYVSTIVRARTSRDVPAGLAPTDALARLLSETGLSFEFLNPRTVRILESSLAHSAAPPGPVQAPNRQSDLPAPPLAPGLDEVVVTAFRRANPASMVYDARSSPAAATVVGGDRLVIQKLEQLTDYASYIPGFNVAGGGSPGQATVILRGIAPEGESSSIAFYLDDAPMGSSGTHGSPWAFPTDLMPYDLERLEVLHGPQETHYGSGSEIGLVRYVLKAPSLSGFEAQVGADLSTISGAGHAGGSMRGALNVPLVEGILGVRASAYDSETPGYINNAYTGARGVNGVRQYGGRIAALWEPLQTLSLRVGAYWHRVESDSNAIESYTGVYTVPNTGAAYVINASTSAGDLTENHAFESPFTQSLDNYSATLHWNPGAIEFTSATAWSRNRTQQVHDDTELVGSQFPQLSGGTVPAGLARFERDLGLEKLSEELRIASAKGRGIEWLLGGFFTREIATDVQADHAFDNAYQPILAFGPAVSYTSLPSTYREWAVFGDLTWQATDRLALIGGARYARDDQSGSATLGGGTQPPAFAARSRSDTSVPWMAAIRYYLAPDVQLYGRAASGYKPGASNAGDPGAPPTVNAETLVNYEAGLKSEFLDRRARVDTSVYYADWRHVQFVDYNPYYNIVDSGNAAAKGAELATAYSPRPGLELTCTAAFTESVFTKTVPPSPDLTGYQLWDVPKWSLALAGNYDAPLTRAWRAHVGGSVRWIDRVWAFPVGSVALGGGPTFELPSYSVIDLHLGISSGRLELKAFARNLADRRAYRGGLEVLNLGNFTWVQLDYYLLQPRTVGVGVDYAL